MRNRRPPAKSKTAPTLQGHEYLPLSTGIAAAQAAAAAAQATANSKANPTGDTGWAVSNYTTRRTYDCSTDTYGDLQDFICTMMQDLINCGIFGA